VHLLRALGGTSVDHDTPINLLTILEHNGVDDVVWTLRSTSCLEAKDEVLKAYQEAAAPARKAYWDATAAAQKAYEEATAPAYWEATAQALKAYREAAAQALKVILS
jgi:hypothetical protein